MKDIRPLPYFVAVTLAISAMTGRWLTMQLPMAESPILFLLAASVASALLGGAGPGLLCTTLCAVMYLAQEELLNADVHASIPIWAGTGIYLSVSVAMIAMVEAQRRASNRQRAAEAARIMSGNELSTLMNASTSPVWIAHDDRAEVITANAAAYALMRLNQGTDLGLDPTQLSGGQFGVFENGDPVTAGDSPLFRACRSGETERTELEFRYADGAAVYLYGSAAPVRDDGNKIRGAILSLVDITERRQLEDSLKRLATEREELLSRERFSRGEAERAARMKDEFLSTVSHELRTPLNAVLGWAELLERHSADDKLRAQGLEAIRRNGRAQAKLIEDVLDMSRIVSGNLRLDMKPVELTPLIDAAIDIVRPAAEVKEIEIYKNVRAPLGTVQGDSPRLQQVILNLLSNAVKFTLAGGRVEIDVTQRGEQIELKVKDSGKGIDPHFLPHLFDTFRQADSSTTRKYGGLGIGLRLVKHLVERHGGLVIAESAGEGRGATFTVTLPASAPSEIVLETPPSEPAVEVQQDLRLHRMKVLLVDDDPDACEVMRRMIEECEAEVMTASSTDEAMKKLRSFKPDLLISDIGMPDKDGYEFIREIRRLSWDEMKDIPALAVTAFARREDRIRALEAGYDLHLPKPIESRQLLSALALLSDNSRGHTH